MEIKLNNEIIFILLLLSLKFFIHIHFKNSLDLSYYLELPEYILLTV